MRVLLISANTEQVNILPLPLGLNCVAVAASRAGHAIRLLDLMTKADKGSVVGRAIELFSPEVIGISVRNIDDQNMNAPRFLLDQAKKVVEDCRKASRAPIVLGGAGYSIFPESSLNYLGADMGIQGEGEMAFPVLLDRMQKGLDIAKTPGLFLPGRGLQCKREFVLDMDSLPLPDPALSSSLLPGKSDNAWMPVQSRRGCPLKCSYCSTASVEGCSVRKRHPSLVVDCIARHVEVGFRQFYFVDNTFNLPPAYARDICRRLISGGLDIKWRAIFYPGKSDKALIGLMAGAGCFEVSLGFESGAENILHKMNKRFNAAQVRRAAELLQAAGIKRMGFLMLGGPGETKYTVEESLAFADSLDLDLLKVTTGIRIYPNTSLAKTAVDDGIISAHDDLLLPRFYIVRGLESWLEETLQVWKAERPYCTS